MAISEIFAQTQGCDFYCLRMCPGTEETLWNETRRYSEEMLDADDSNRLRHIKKHGFVAYILGFIGKGNNKIVMMVYFRKSQDILRQMFHRPNSIKWETKVASICVESVRTVGSCLESVKIQRMVIKIQVQEWREPARKKTMAVSMFKSILETLGHTILAK